MAPMISRPVDPRLRPLPQLIFMSRWNVPASSQLREMDSTGRR